MNRIVYLNGQYLPDTEARISIFDRGFLMADGVYEVTTVVDGQLVDFQGHMARLSRSLQAIDMQTPLSDDQLLAVHSALIEKNSLVEGLIYLQVTRGSSGDRDFLYPPPEVEQTVVLFTQNKPGLSDAPGIRNGIRVVTIPDIRWGRRDIKTVQLLYPAMGKMMAKSFGADDAWMVDAGHVTEGTSNNAYIVRDGVIATRALSTEILHGITRSSVLDLARMAGLEVEQNRFTPEEAQKADEAFVTSASSFITPVIEIDGVAIGDGKPGPVVRRLQQLYMGSIRSTVA